MEVGRSQRDEGADAERGGGRGVRVGNARRPTLLRDVERTGECPDMKTKDARHAYLSHSPDVLEFDTSHLKQGPSKN